MGLQVLKDAGVTFRVHRQVKKKHLFYAGTEEERAQAFFDFAVDASISVLWCARGGYGAGQLLRFLDRMTAEHGIPEKKLLVGYSDASSLMEYVQAKWGWSALHAPMPGLRDFSALSGSELGAVLDLIQGKFTKTPTGKHSLKFFGPKPKHDVQGPLMGGNLAVWTSLLGTPYAPRLKGRILFLEEVTESLARIDRMVQQLVDSGGLERVHAIVLGTFTRCHDSASRVLKAVPPAKSRKRVLAAPKPSELVPLRKEVSLAKGLQEIFGEVGDRFGIPIAYGLPVGHGNGHAPLPLGAHYKLTPSGRLEMLKWCWIDSQED